MLPTLLLVLAMMASGIVYFVQTEMIAAEFVKLGFPEWSLYFNATAKLLGGVVLLSPKSPIWMWHYALAGYLYIILLALFAHLAHSSAETPVVIGFLVLWCIVFYQHTYGNCKK